MRACCTESTVREQEVDSRECVLDKENKNVSLCLFMSVRVLQKAGQKCVCMYFCVYCVLVSCWHVFVWADLIPSRMVSAHYSSGIVLQTSPEGSACWEIKQRK